MELAVTNMFIKSLHFIGIMRSAIVKDFHDIKLKIDFYKISSSDRQMVEIVEKSCLEDHVNPNALKLVSNELIYSKKFNYGDAEYFRNYLNFITTRNLYDDRVKNQMWIIEFKFPNNTDVNFFRINLDSDQVTRLFTQINSFYSNFMLFSAISKQHVSVENVSKEEQVIPKKVTEYAKVAEESAIILETEKVSQITPISKERNELDDIFELCINSSIKSSLIHYTFNYFKYFTSSHCRIQTNQKNQVQYIIPTVIPAGLNFDIAFFESLIQANKNVSSNNVIFVIKKILNNMYTNYQKYQNQPLLMMMISYLLFIYMLKHLNDINQESFQIHFRKLVFDPDTQTLLVRSLITTNTFQDFSNKLYFKFVKIDTNTVFNDLEIEKINKISQEYKHLIPVSSTDFINKIFENLDDQRQLPILFNISSKKVIDISKFINSSKTSLTNSILVDPDSTIDNSISDSSFYSLLRYESINNTRVISQPYQHIINYMKNPGTVLLLKETDLPKEIINLFEILVSKVLNRSVIEKDNISTLNYYNILLENLPHPENFNHITFLFIIFQIMIPFHYDVYNTNQFIDYLL